MSTLAEQTARAQTQLRARWKALSLREQHALKALAALLGLSLFWLGAIAPALNTLRDSAQRREAIAQQHSQMRDLQAQAQALQQTTPLPQQEALKILKTLHADAAIEVQAQGPRVTVQLKNVPATTLANWLAQARQQALAIPLEAHLTRSGEASERSPDSEAQILWSGRLVLRLASTSTEASAGTSANANAVSP